MNTHYICRGRCQNLSDKHHVCKDADCDRFGKDLEPCQCLEGDHFGAQDAQNEHEEENNDKD